eukprot:2496510-Alexandrium_andersonii.AAC.1
MEDVTAADRAGAHLSAARRHLDPLRRGGGLTRTCAGLSRVVSVGHLKGVGALAPVTHVGVPVAGPLAGRRA